MREHFVNEFEKLKCLLVIELYHTQMTHERWTVKAIHDQFDLLCVEIGRLAENLSLWAGLLHAIYLSFS